MNPSFPGLSIEIITKQLRHRFIECTRADKVIHGGHYNILGATLKKCLAKVHSKLFAQQCSGGTVYEGDRFYNIIAFEKHIRHQRGHDSTERITGEAIRP